MRDDGRRVIDIAPAGSTEPRTQVNIFELHEESRVKASDGFQCLTANEHARAREPAHVSQGDMLVRVIAVIADAGAEGSILLHEQFGFEEVGRMGKVGFNARRQSPVELTVLINALPLGVTRNFEQAIGLCTGDLIALCDQDDIWHASKLERLAHEFENRPDLSLLHSDLRLVDREGKPLH